MPKSAVRFRFIIGLSAALILLFLGAVPHLQAATLTVANTDDSGDGSLRQAIDDANTTPGADIINFDVAVNGTITLLRSLPTITDNLDITGPGEATLSVSGNNVLGVRPFTIGAGAVVTISGLTVEKGKNRRMGGGILNYGELTLTNSTVRNNEARGGGGISNFGGELTLENVTVNNNTAGSFGGGIYNDSTVTLINSHVDYNSAPYGYGGGIESGGARLTLTNSTVNNNTATQAGGGIKAYWVQLTLTNSTVNHNTVGVGYDENSGGGMEVSGTVTLINSHVDYNSARFTGGIKFLWGTLTMDDSSTVSDNGKIGIYHPGGEGTGEMILNGGTVSNHERAGIWNGVYGIMTVNDSTVSGNEVGIRNQTYSTMTLNRVTVSGNSGYYGNGIENYGGTLSLNNSTVSDNTGHGIADFSRPDRLTLFLSSSTVSGNGGSGITSFRDTTPAAGGLAELINTIVANNTEADCAFPETITSLGHNLDSDGTCNLDVVLNDLPSTDPVLLGPLADNGGPTKTHALLAGSPAIDAGSYLFATDQRGITRPQGSASDIGAYEYEPGEGCENDTDAPVVSGTTASPNPVEVDTEVTLIAQVEDLCSNIQYAQYNVDGGEWSSEYYPDGTSNSETISINMSSGTEPGVFTVCVQGTDVAGNISNEECIYLPVYDPSAGFVTGGGWIDSPEGAYVADPSAVGKANFGFVAKYKKGKTEPDGNTEFQFKAADLNFHSSEYEWLVVTGSNYAKFKGSGTINGEGSYKFMIWAGDGDTDTFRIKIWEEDAEGTETVTYDNGFDQAIGGGNIVIHNK